MSNNVMAHIEHEKVVIGLSDLQKHSTEEYRTLDFGMDLCVFMTNKQAETLFKELDEKLHESTVTYEYMKNELSEKEDIIFNIQQDLDEANENVERLQDSLQENFV